MQRSRFIATATFTTITAIALSCGISSPALAAAPASSVAVAASNAPTDSSTTPRGLDAIQKAAATQTAARTAALNRAIPAVTRNRFLTEADRAEILSRLNAALAGMQSLAATIAADTDAATAATHYQQIFTDYRVYAVALPQAHYAAAADGLTGIAIPKLVEVQQKLQAAIDADPSRSTPEIEASMASLAAHIIDAQSAIDGVAAAALAVTPADYNANKAVLAPVKADVTTAVSAARLARLDAQSVREALR
jgi:hypothetical protein